MAESSTSVRLLQHHLRQSGMLLATGQLDAAAAHLDAALAIDPASLAALALRERLTRLQASTSRPIADTGLRANALVSAPADAPPASGARFVPSGVNAASWTDFEQRIQQRRFRALIEAGDRAIVAGDLAAARASVEEARELQPDSLEVSRLSIRIATMPMLAADARKRESLFRSRTFRAASLLLLGVSLLMGLDWVRSGDAITQTNNLDPVGTAGRSADGDLAANEEPTPPPPSEDPVAGNVEPAPDAAVVEILSDVPVVAREPAPIAPAEPAPRRELPPGETADDYVPRPSSLIARNLVVTSPVLTGEIPDNYVVPSRRELNVGRDPLLSVSGGRASAPPIANVFRQPAPVVETLVASPGATTSPTASPAPIVPAAAATAMTATASELSRVRSVLDQYARAQGRLDASAVRAVYPSVDERALAKAFSNLRSQNVSFEDCQIAFDSAASAKASCRGKASYVGKVGIQEQRTESRTVRFELKRDGEAWKIEKAQTGR